MFGTLEARFQPQAAEGLDITIGYDIGGEEGGQWTATIKDGTCTVTEELVPSPSLTMAVKAKDWVELMLGKVEAATLMTTGRAKVGGDMNLAVKLAELFAKYTAPGEEEGEEQELLVLKKTISVNQKFPTGPVMGKFLNGLKEKKIFANKCPRCARLQLPPREVCAECVVRVTEFVEVGPEGILTTPDITYYASPDPLTGESREAPYISAHFLLDGCKGHETFWHELKASDIDKAQRGVRVRPVWNEERVGAVSDIKYFEVIE